jgi:group I intron endonuclease
MHKSSGVYAIVNLLNGKCYIGSAIKLEKRFKEHRNALLRGDHNSILMQRAWDKYGPDAFEIRTLLHCEAKNCTYYEQRCIDGYKPEYNICPTAGSRLGSKYTEEARARLALLRKAAPRSEKQLQHLANLAEAARGKPGRAHTDEQRAKIAASLTGKKLSEQHKANITAAVPRGWTHTEEAKAKIAAAKIGKKRAPYSDEWRAKISAANTGRKPSPESVAKMIKTRSERHALRKAEQP